MTAMRLFINVILVMGLLRFVLTVSGIPDSVVKYFSMTAILLAGAVYFAIACATWKRRLKAAYWLILPYMIVEVLALGYTWTTGRRTIFHSPAYSLGTSLPLHTAGHFVGGLTWEPLILFVAMEVIRRLYTGGRWLFRR